MDTRELRKQIWARVRNVGALDFQMDFKATRQDFKKF